VPHNSQSLPAIVPPENTNDSGSLSPFPDPRVVPIGTFNLSAYGWVNGRYDSSNANVKDGNLITNPAARAYQATNSNTGAPIGVQGRYYKSAVRNGQTLDFTHFVLIDGAEYMIDFPAKGGRTGGAGGRIYARKFAPNDTDQVRFLIPTTDFSAGDKIQMSTFGGAFGLPKPGASVTFEVTPSAIPLDGSGNQTNEEQDCEDILVVPNPYIVTNIAQKSSYDAKIYFSHLPKVCTIKIFTVNGDLIRVIEHNDTDGSMRQGVDVWDLLSDNKQRAASQGLLAYIETPNGINCVKKFAVIVGGSRLIR
jgi:hypothetical protein